MFLSNLEFSRRVSFLANLKHLSMTLISFFVYSVLKILTLLWCMDTHLSENNFFFNLFLLRLSNGRPSSCILFTKEAPHPTHTHTMSIIFLEYNSFWKGYAIQGAKHEVTEVVALCKKWRTNMDVYSFA